MRKIVRVRDASAISPRTRTRRAGSTAAPAIVERYAADGDPTVSAAAIAELRMLNGAQ